jgi:hypothetical protein
MGDMLARLLERLSREWHVISEAKAIFATAAFVIFVVTAAGTWWLNGLLYGERIFTGQHSILGKRTRSKRNDLLDMASNVSKLQASQSQATTTSESGSPNDKHLPDVPAEK